MESIKEKVEKILIDIRPYLHEDGGDVEFVNFEEDNGTLVLRLLGSCAKCPLHMMTLRAGIERLILHAIPEVRRVEKC
jgi:Fe-S cluster biogenesis protein NfuA